jgi:hypothetical protein
MRRMLWIYLLFSGALVGCGSDNAVVGLNGAPGVTGEDGQEGLTGQPGEDGRYTVHRRYPWVWFAALGSQAC